MPKTRHAVYLTDGETDSLKALTHKGSGESARTIMHANILLLTNVFVNLKRAQKTAMIS